MSKIDNERSLFSGWVEELTEGSVIVEELHGSEARRCVVPRRGLHLICGEFVQIAHCLDEAGEEMLHLVPEDTNWNTHQVRIA